MAYLEKRCSVCGKVSWTSDGGYNYSRHARDPQKPNVTEPCDMQGGTYDDMGRPQ